MTKWPWLERKFNFDYPAAKFPDILERVRGTPARVEEAVRGLDRDALTRQPARGWSIQQHIGHLIDLGYLPLQRIEDALAGNDVLCAADLTNRRTNEADHNGTALHELLRTFRDERAKLVTRLEALDESDWEKSGIHPRLQQPMRIVDIAYFDAEHDDYHLARIRELIRGLAPRRGRLD